MIDERVGTFTDAMNIGLEASFIDDFAEKDYFMVVFTTSGWLTEVGTARLILVALRPDWSATACIRHSLLHCRQHLPGAFFIRKQT